MRKPILSLTVVVLIAAIACPLVARADESPQIKPVAVLSLSGYNNVMADVELIGQMTDRPHLREGVEGMLIFVTQGQGLVGLDKTRPCGILAGTDGEHVGACAFVPVTDLDKLIGVLSAWHPNKVTKGDDGIYEVTCPKKTVYVQEAHKGWAFVVDNKDHLAHVPANPASWLEGLNRQYDVAVRFYVSNMPTECRDKMIAGLHKGLEKMAKHHHRKHHKHPWQKEKAALVHANMKQAVGDLEQLTIGMSLDNDLHQGIIEITAQARPGTPTAKHLAKVGKMRSRFAGFALPEAAITGRGTTQCPGVPADKLDDVIEKMRKEAYRKIDKKSKSDEHAKVAREVVDKVLDVMKQTALEGRHDGAVSVSLDDDAMTLIAGRQVAEGPKLEQAVKLLVAQVRKEHPEKVDGIIKLDADRYQGVNFHVASLPIPKDCPRNEQVTKAVGKRFEVVLGVGSKAVYVAAGRNAQTSLKQAIKASQLKSRWPVPPVDLTVDLGELAEFVEDFGPPKCQAKADQVDDLLEKAHGQDRIHVTAVPGKRSMTLRVELDEGVLRVINAMKCKKHHKK